MVSVLGQGYIGEGIISFTDDSVFKSIPDQSEPKDLPGELQGGLQGDTDEDMHRVLKNVQGEKSDPKNPQDKSAEIKDDE